MKIRLLALLSTVVLTLTLGLLATATATAAQDDGAVTEDILFLHDGRELHGTILEETRSEIVFQFVDRRSGISTKLRFEKDEVSRIERDIVLENAPDKPKTTRTSGSRGGGDDDSAASSQPASDWAYSYGVRRASLDEDVPSFYIVPMNGQMGTDIHHEVYEKLIEDVRAHDPDYLVIVMDCKDREERLYSRIAREDAGLHGSNHLDMYRDMVAVFRQELRDIPQVLWIEDSLGISSVIAMSWENIYMKPGARLGGIARAAANFDVQDPEKLAKFREGYMGWLKGFAEYGGHSHDLIDAMVLPEYKLSASWKGRDVVWRLDTKGEYIVDDNDKATTEFQARTAENFCISKGTVETMDDLALMLGIREYRVLEGDADRIHTKYKEDWRRAYDNCKEWYQDYNQALGWANGQDALKYLGKAKGYLERILASIDRYKAIETRMAMEYGVRRGDLIVEIEKLKERIRALRRTGRGGGGRGGGGAGAGSGGG